MIKKLQFDDEGVFEISKNLASIASDVLRQKIPYFSFRKSKLKLKKVSFKTNLLGRLKRKKMKKY